MSARRYLRELITDRLTVAAAEIFGAFESAIDAYEAELARHRSVLEIVCKPEVKLHRIDLPQQPDCTEEVLLPDQESSSNLDSTEMKEEQEETPIALGGNPRLLRQETDMSISTVKGTGCTGPEPDEDHNKLLSLGRRDGESQDLTRSKDVERNVVIPERFQDTVWEPAVKLQLIELSRRGVWKDVEEKTLTERKTCERWSISNREEPSTPETEKMGISRDREQFVPKKTPDDEKGDRVETETDGCRGNCEKRRGVPKAHLKKYAREKPYPCQICSRGRNILSQRVSHKKQQASEKPHTCKTCGKGFTHYSSLEKHMRSHTGERTNACEACGKRANDSKLKVHRRARTGQKPLPCGKCFRRQIYLNLHMRTHASEKSFSRARCGKCLTHCVTHKAHVKFHTVEKPLSCASSGKCFKHQNQPNVTCRTGEKSLSCATCGKCFTERSMFEAHVRTCAVEKPFSCASCGKCFEQQTQLNVHMRTHTDKKPVIYKTFGKCFSSSETLKTHVSGHTDQTPFICKICGRCFRDQHTLKAHVRSHAGEKLFSCETCGKHFTQQGNLRVHMRRHTGEKPFSCERCGKQFAQQATLNVHVRRHTGEKPFSCTTCGKHFTQQATLNVHVRRHTGEKPFSCTTCGKHFTQQSNLNVHMSRHADEKPFSGEMEMGFRLKVRDTSLVNSHK